MENAVWKFLDWETYFAFWVHSIPIYGMFTASKAEMMNLISKEGFWH